MSEYKINPELRVFELREKKILFGLAGTTTVLVDANTGEEISPDELQVSHIALNAVGYRVKLFSGFFSDNSRPAFGTVTDIDADYVYVEGKHDGESYTIPRDIFPQWYCVDTNME